MKRLLWLTLLAIVPISNAFGEKQPINNSQNGPFGIYYIPKWYMDASVAANCYQTGMSYITSDPKSAIKAFELGLLYARKAEALGGGEEAENISLALSRELKIAETNLKPGSSKDNSGNNNSSANNKNAGNESGQTLTHASVPKNSGITIKTSGNLARLGGSQTVGSPNTRSGF